MASVSGNPIEVFLGERIDPANYWMFLVSDLDKIHGISKDLDQINLRGQMLRVDELKPGKLVAVRIHEKKTYQSSWYRAQIQTVTSLMDASTTVDVFLIDYGTEEKNVKFPRDISHLIDNYHLVDPFAFKYNLNGIVPFKKSYKFEPIKNEDRPFLHVRKREWTEHAETFTHYLVMMFSRAWIHVEEWTGLNGNQATAGKLTVEIERQSLKYFLPNFKSVLEAGGFSENFPIVDVNKALVAQKLAICVESIKPDRGSLMPKLTRYQQPKEEELNSAQNNNNSQPKTEDEKDTDEKEQNEQKLIEAMRRLKMIQDLEEHLKI